MSKPDTPPPGQAPAPWWAQLLLERQKRTAQAVADLAVGLSTQATRERENHGQLMGLLLGLLSDQRQAAGGEPESGPYRKPQRAAHAGPAYLHEHVPGEDSARIRLPGGTEIEVPSKDYKAFGAFAWKAAKVLFFVVAAVGGWIIHLYKYMQALGH